MARQVLLSLLVLAVAFTTVQAAWIDKFSLTQWPFGSKQAADSPTASQQQQRQLGEHRSAGKGSKDAHATAHASIGSASAKVEAIKRRVHCALYQWKCKHNCQHACCYVPASILDNQLQPYCNLTAAKESHHPYYYCCKSVAPWDDPIFVDMQGRRFEFLGEAGSIYNIFSQATHSANMRLISAGERHVRLQHGDGTFADALAFQLPGNTKILVEVNEAGDMAVTIDDEELDLQQAFTLDLANAQVSFAPFAENVGEQLTIRTDLFIFEVNAVKAFEDDESGFNRGHLNMQSQILAPPGSLEGILGSTMYVKPTDRQHESTNFAFPDSGKESSYRVAGLWDGIPLRNAASLRRRLIDTNIAFPVSASLQSSMTSC